MSAKSKSSLSETPNKLSPATPRVSKISRGVAKPEAGSPSPLHKPRASIDRSPQSINSKPAIDRRSPRLATPPDKAQARVVKGSELQAQLSQAQEDLKKAKEQIASIEQEKAQAIDELKEAQRAAEEANEKLREALVAQKRAEEDSEIEKFRAVELEQAGIEAAQKKEEEWKKEIEAVRNQHALDVSSLLSTTKELQRVKQELAMTIDARNQALGHADDATKSAEIHAEKVEMLSAELSRLQSLLESKLETESKENNKLVLELKSEIEHLNEELEKAMICEEKLMEKEAYIEQLSVELEAARMAESYARSLAEEWKSRVEVLQLKVEEAKKLERSASESLKSVMKQLEGKNDLLHSAEAEIDALEEKVGLLEMTVERQKGDLVESERKVELAIRGTYEMEKTVESLQSELEKVREEKTQALNNEQLAASSVQSLLEEKNKLINDLESSRDEEEKSKKAMESLASALHEVSAEAREAKERLLCVQAEHENYESQIEDLKLVLKATNEKFETLLDDAKHEIDFLTSSIEQSRSELYKSKNEWEQKELHLINSVKQSEDEKASMKKEIERLVNLLRQAEEENCGSKEEGVQLKDSLKEVESEVILLQETLAATKAESMKLKQSLRDKENELENILQENEELRTREAVSITKVGELSKLLEEAMDPKQGQENGNLSDSEKDYDLLPKVVEFSEENGQAREEKPKMGLQMNHYEEPKRESSSEENNALDSETVQIDSPKVENVNGKPNNEKSKVNEDESVEVREFKMWESCKIEKKELSPGTEPEHESLEEEVDLKEDGHKGFDQINTVPSAENMEDGKVSPSKQEQHKKKKPLLRKFGNLLKKKSSTQK